MPTLVYYTLENNLHFGLALKLERYFRRGNSDTSRISDARNIAFGLRVLGV